MNLRKKICENKQGVAEELGKMIVRKKAKKAENKKIDIFIIRWGLSEL